ncbi:hypothetical protein EMIT0P171_90226 [Pseudomonas sp. IT-P171]
MQQSHAYNDPSLTLTTSILSRPTRPSTASTR